MYDFDAEPGSGEVSIRVGDILTVTRTDVGEGWWEGTTPQSQTGLFPEAYVEEISVEETNTAPPAMAPPPLPPDYGAVGAGGAGGAWNLPTAAPAAAAVQDDWDDPWGGGGGGTAPAQQPPQQDWQPDVSLPGSLTLSPTSLYWDECCYAGHFKTNFRFPAEPLPRLVVAALQALQPRYAPCLLSALSCPPVLSLGGDRRPPG